MATTPPQPLTAGRATPLTPLLVFVFVASLGTSAITHGVYFLTESVLGYGRVRNYALACVFGVIYIASAAGVGPLLRKLARIAPRLSSRGLIGACLGVIGLTCLLPMLVRNEAGAPAPWTLWLLMINYAGATGLLWPITESYISGGRSGRALRSATGRFNVVWSGATVLALLLMVPLIKSAPLWYLTGVGLAHLLTLPLLRFFAREPATHIDLTLPLAEPHPPIYRALLRVVRVMLPLSYLLSAALIPQLPSAMERLQVDASWKPGIASVYFLTRFLVFGLFERYHAWHGRAWAPIAGGLALAGGFALTVLAPELAGEAGARALISLIAGLGLFGAGAAIVYACAIYYAMEVGSASVDAGGAHEALIGCGYTLGPVCGLGAVALAPVLGLRVESATTLTVLVVSIAIGIAGWRVIARAGKLRRFSDV
jgi:hypothetical protein